MQIYKICVFPTLYCLNIYQVINTMFHSVNVGKAETSSPQISWRLLSCLSTSPFLAWLNAISRCQRPGQLVARRKCHPKSIFQKWAPFSVILVKMENMSPSMSEQVREEGLCEKPRQLLVRGMKAEKIFLASPLLWWYLKHGLVVTEVHKSLEYIPKACFKPFTDQVSQARRNGDDDADTAIIAETMKLVGNSTCGKRI